MRGDKRRDWSNIQRLACVRLGLCEGWSWVDRGVERECLPGNVPGRGCQQLPMPTSHCHPNMSVTTSGWILAKPLLFPDGHTPRPAMQHLPAHSLSAPHLCQPFRCCVSAPVQALAPPPQACAGLWRHHHDGFARFVAAVCPTGAERALQLSGLTLAAEAVLSRKAGALRRAVQCLVAAAAGAHERAALNLHALWHARVTPGQAIASLDALISGGGLPLLGGGMAHALAPLPGRAAGAPVIMCTCQGDGNAGRSG